MPGKPNILRKLDKGKAIDTQIGFVDTFNWLVDFVGNLRGAGRVRIDGAALGRPVISLDGDNAASPGNFEPVFAGHATTSYVDNEQITTYTNILSGVGEGYYPVGRRFYSNATLDSSAQISSGYVWLEVVYPTSSSSSPTATIKGGASFPTNDATAITATKSWMPLYKIADGRIAVDYRSAMSLTLREL